VQSSQTFQQGLDGNSNSINSIGQLIPGGINLVLLGRAERATADVVETVKEVKTTAKKTRRKLSEWQRYVKNGANHIKFKRGPKKGRLDLAAMSKAFKRRSKK
jgi:hypothetical protein